MGARDPRLGLMRRSWFEGKKCLDVGCNEGHLTIAIVRSFRPRRMVGIDIDSYLVQLAKRVSAARTRSSGCTFVVRWSPFVLTGRVMMGQSFCGFVLIRQPAGDDQEFAALLLSVLRKNVALMLGGAGCSFPGVRSRGKWQCCFCFALSVQASSKLCGSGDKSIPSSAPTS